tara:strand:+ start:247 stop:561 length:315 start_codon:yes stop_codon:yes gene_type:complete
MRSGFQYEIFKNPLIKNAGINFAIREEIIEINTIIKKYDLQDFRLSDGIKYDDYLYQRSIEYNYPIRIDENSKFIFYLKSEEIKKNCNILELQKYFKLTKCKYD